MNLKETDVLPYALTSVSGAPDVWVFAPHPDDEVFGCGGALALHAMRGALVRVVLLTEGEQQVADSSCVTTSVRQRESVKAASVLGYTELTCWQLPDRSVHFGEALVERVMACLVQTPLSVVYAPSLWEAHPDHRACGMAVAEAIRRLGGSRELWFYEVSAPLRANALIDVTSVWPAKTQAMACFASQEAVLPYSEYISALNRYRALTVLPQGRVEAFERYSAAELTAFAIDSPGDALRQRGVPAVPADLPLVSIIIRTMGRPTLARAVASVYAQTYSHLEVVVVNASGGAALPEAVTRPGVRVVSRGARLGRSDAANEGLLAAKGAWLMFLDDDDWLYPDHVAKLIRAQWVAGGAIGYYSDVECLDATGARTGTVFAQPYARNELIYGNFLPIHSVLFNRCVVDDGARFDSVFDLYEDWDFWLQVEQRGRFDRVPGVSAAYVVGGASGEGVAVEAERAQRATDALFAKWGVLLNKGVFNELVHRALDRRRLQALESTFLGQQADAHGRLNEALAQQADLHHRLHSEQQACARALADADRARADAHALRTAHDHACADRDAARQDAAAARQDAANARQDLGAVRQECSVLRSERDGHKLNAATVANQRDQQTLLLIQSQERERDGAGREHALALERDHALDREMALTQALQAVHQRLYEAELRAEHLRARFEQVVASRSWAITKPLRLATRVAQVAKRMGAQGAFERGVTLVREQGIQGVLGKMDASVLQAAGVPVVQVGKTYADWVDRFDALTSEAVAGLSADLAALTARPKVSVVMPVYNTLERDLTAAIESVRAQIYGDWELCICDDASTEPHVAAVLSGFARSDNRIKVVRREKNGHISAASNTALALCTGEYIAFFDHDDVLAPHALLRVVEWFEQHPSVRLVYSDEDKIGLDGQRFDPYFKPDFNLGLLRSHNYMCHFAVYERTLVAELGGIRVGFEGAQDYDLALRAVDVLSASQIGHIPHVLYHWRVTPGSTAGGHQEKSYAFLAGQRALTEHLVRRCLHGEVIEAPEAPGMYRVRWTLPATVPTVSIVIPTRNGIDLLKTCLDSLKTTIYGAFEVIVVDNGSDDPAVLTLMAEREKQGEIKVLRDPSPFNYSALNNRAVREMCSGEFVVLMNNDIEITHPEWLSEMVGVALEPGVGCVGARLWYPDGRLQHGGVIMVCGVAGHAHKYLPRGQHGYMGRAVLTQDFLAVTAACLLIRRSVFEQVGGLDESLKVAFNDVDFCLRVYTAGYRNVWTPFAQMVHHESVTRGHEDTPEKQQRFAGEVAVLQKRWPALLAADPCYSPNLTNQAEDFSYAWPPRRRLP